MPRIGLEVETPLATLRLQSPAFALPIRAGGGCFTDAVHADLVRGAFFATAQLGRLTLTVDTLLARAALFVSTRTRSLTLTVQALLVRATIRPTRAAVRRR